MNIIKLITTIGLCLLAGGIGSLATMPAINSWYVTLNKPSFSPPNWLFGPVWTALYILMGIAAYLIWREAGSKNIKGALIIFVMQLLLNIFWSLIFFGLRQPGWALGEIIVMWMAILATILAFYPISKIATGLLIPYLLWVTFASFLNLMIVRLN